MDNIYYSPYLMGGLCNQMFQIASIYGLSRKHNRKYLFSENYIDNSQTIIHSKNKYKNYFDTIFCKLKQYRKDDIKCNLYRESIQKVGKPHDIIFNNNTLFYGYYQNFHNWDGYKDEVKNLFYFENKKYDKYDTDNSFFIHFRRGDYVNNSYHEVVNNDYYKNALKYFNVKKVLIFSNEKNYGMKLDFLKDYEKVFVDEDEIDSLNIMRQCKYGGICANSSFSWWGAYLNNSKDKIITVPCKWFGINSRIKDFSGYFCEEFNIIKY